METEVSTPVATPENTPPPGGGSWHWDDLSCGWVENTGAPQSAVPQPQAEAPITETYRSK